MAFTFSVSPLPRYTYDLVKRVGKAYTLNNRQVIIAALRLLAEEGLANPTRVQVLFEGVKEDHPQRRRARTPKAEDVFGVSGVPSVP